MSYFIVYQTQSRGECVRAKVLHGKFEFAFESRGIVFFDCTCSDDNKIYTVKKELFFDDLGQANDCAREFNRKAMTELNSRKLDLKDDLEIIDHDANTRLKLFEFFLGF